MKLCTGDNDSDAEASTKLAESEGLLGTRGVGYGAAETGRSHGDKD